MIKIPEELEEWLITADKRTYDCPHCNIKSLHIKNVDIPDYEAKIIIKGMDGQDYEQKVKMKHLIYRCVDCNKDTYFLIKGNVKVMRNDHSSSHVPGYFSGDGENIVAESPAEILHQYPIPTPTLHRAVNEDVKCSTIEAESCFSVRAFNACGVMTRRAMHSLCADKGAQGKDLYEQLKYLKDNNLITPDLWEWAEELRIVGRSGAHPEWEEVSKEDAEYALRFLREIIRYIYINPAERAARRLKETKKKKP
jgi:DNA-directed RNA polymerase subunit RPC12/RpoP